MKSCTRKIAVISTVLITAGFVLSGFHHHDERNPDRTENEVSIVHEMDYCLLCEGVTSNAPANPVSAEGYVNVSEENIILQITAFSSPLIHIQNSRAPPEKS